MKTIGVVLLAILGAAAHAKQPPRPNFTNDGLHHCLNPYWPFQSWTGKWSCIKGEFEAKSTWNLYKGDESNELFSAGSFTLDYRKYESPKFDPEKAWFIEVEFSGSRCEALMRKDGLVHSMIVGQEYVQTCDDGKLGILKWVPPQCDDCGDPWTPQDLTKLMEKLAPTAKQEPQTARQFCDSVFSPRLVKDVASFNKSHSDEEKVSIQCVVHYDTVVIETVH